LTCFLLKPAPCFPAHAAYAPPSILRRPAPSLISLFGDHATRRWCRWYRCSRCRHHSKPTRLFPLLTPGSRRGLGEGWSKWFGRYIRNIGITNPASVFHSFRHGFKDALRAAGVDEDVNDALTGHVGPGTVARKYGAKEMVRRFGLERLVSAVSQVRYPGLDLNHLCSAESPTKRD
jgi:hypothetical protein